MTNYNWNGVVLDEWKQLQDAMSKKEQAWKDFMQFGKQPDSNDILYEIFCSWKRCKDRSIDPYDENIVTVPAHVLSEKLSENNQIIELVRPILQETAENIIDSGYRIDLYDKELCLLTRFGKKISGGDSERRELIVGESHAEANVGTTSTNLAALLNRPIQLMSYEHYKTMFHNLTCSSVPISDINGQLLLVLTVEGYCWPMHKHTMGMLVTLKHYIEHLISKDKHIYRDIEKRTTSEVIDMISEPTFIIDRTEKILFANAVAQNSVAQGWSSLEGFSCKTVWGKNPFRSVFSTKNTIVDRRVTLRCDAKENVFYATAKPVTDENGSLVMVIGTLRKKADTNSKHVDLSEKFKAKYRFDSIIGKSPEVKEVIKLSRETARFNNNILLFGESGTGKELFAQSIHNESDYSEGPFVPINCSAIPATLLESELFGYEGGAFTGSRAEGQLGKFEIANGGTLFLDEINSMPMEMQTKLLRVLQDKKIVRVGGTEQIPIDVRIIVSTNEDLWDLVKENKFRDDLYYRLNVISISLPPLRERQGDIDVLVDYFVDKFAKQFKQKIRLSNEARNLLRLYPWPGNVRELENTLERCLVISRVNGKNNITMNDISESGGIFEYFNNSHMEDAFTEKAESEADNSKTSEDGVLVDRERQTIIELLRNNDDNIQLTAKNLGISRTTLYRKIKKYGIERIQKSS